MSEEKREQIKMEIVKYKQDSRYILEKVKKAGLPIPDRDDNDDLHAEWSSIKKSYSGLSNVPSHKLGEFLDKFNSVLAYGFYCTAIADYEHVWAKNVRDFALAKMLLTVPSCKTVALQEAMVLDADTDGAYQELCKDYDSKYAGYKLMSALVNGYEKQAESISREITRRGNQNSLNGRNENIK